MQVLILQLGSIWLELEYRLARVFRLSPLLPAKDATFHMIKVTDKPALYAFELSGHPEWFMWHRRTKPYTLKLKEVHKVSQTVLDATFYLMRIACPAEEDRECR